jgi:hypothetical protein
MNERRHTANECLRRLVAAAGLTQRESLEVFNKGQARPLALDSWRSFFCQRNTKRYRRFRPEWLDHFERALSAFEHGARSSKQGK